ncbi:MAG: outer membrane protein assembly factor BamB [Nevskiaceae bacterium]|jgi:outer membrane protein assembly factor BamB|nr:outer membrane protein assembly factor BamB [Nevskiaceae bacterium]
MTPHPLRPWLGTLLLAVGLASMAGCDKDKNIDPPAELTKFQSTAVIRKVWSANAGDGEPKMRLGLGPATEGEMVYSADHEGHVSAFALQNGRRVWRIDTKLPLTAGPGVGEGIVVAGASHGDIVALDAKTGKTLWKTRVNSELLSAPVIVPRAVVVRAVDGRVIALAPDDGRQLWSMEQQVPRLSLRGTSRPVVTTDMVIAGFDNGRVLALNLADGATLWDSLVSPPSGRTELERLIDIDAAVRLVGDDVYAVTYQGRIARLARDSGQTWWSRDLSSYHGLAVDGDGVYVSTADGKVVKMDSATGVEAWSQDVLSHRRLSVPAVVGEYVLVGDYDGYVHVLNAHDGALAAREHVGGERMAADPLVLQDGTVIFQDAKGDLVALRVEPR